MLPVSHPIAIRRLMMYFFKKIFTVSQSFDCDQTTDRSPGYLQYWSQSVTIYDNSQLPIDLTLDTGKASEMVIVANPTDL